MRQTQRSPEGPRSAGEPLPEQGAPGKCSVPRPGSPVPSISSRDAGLLEPPERPQGSPASSSVWTKRMVNQMKELSSIAYTWWTGGQSTCIGRRILYPHITREAQVVPAWPQKSTPVVELACGSHPAGNLATATPSSGPESCEGPLLSASYKTPVD